MKNSNIEKIIKTDGDAPIPGVSKNHIHIIKKTEIDKKENTVEELLNRMTLVFNSLNIKEISFDVWPEEIESFIQSRFEQTKSDELNRRSLTLLKNGVCVCLGPYYFKIDENLKSKFLRLECSEKILSFFLKEYKVSIDLEKERERSECKVLKVHHNGYLVVGVSKMIGATDIIVWRPNSETINKRFRYRTYVDALNYFNKWKSGNEPEGWISH